MKSLTLRILIRKIYRKLTIKINEKYISKLRNKLLKNKNFTIISNNCWAGWVYRRYNLPYMTPTIGLFIMPEDYVKFVKKLKEYVSLKLEFIKPSESKYSEYISSVDDRFGKYPIGKLKDIEIHFLHYKSKKEALEKWNKRVKRINYDNILIKFSDQNNCKIKSIETFSKLNYSNKIVFTGKKLNLNDCIYVKEYRKIGYVKDDVLFSTKYINLTKYINNMKLKKQR